jgi:hypothetical protein
MTKAIASYPKGKQAEVISRRIGVPTGGLGYLAAKDAVTAKVRAQILEQGKAPLKVIDAG